MRHRTFLTYSYYQIIQLLKNKKHKKNNHHPNNNHSINNSINSIGKHNACTSFILYEG